MGQTCSQCFNKETYETRIVPQKNNDVFSKESKDIMEDEIRSAENTPKVATSKNHAQPSAFQNNESVLKESKDFSFREENNKPVDEIRKKKKPSLVDKIKQDNNVKHVIFLQRFRRNIKNNKFIQYTEEAKNSYKKNKKLDFFMSSDFINKISIKKPFNPLNWMNFYEKNQENKKLFEIESKQNNINMKIIDKDWIYIGEVNEKKEKNGYGVLYTANGEMFKGTWENNTLKGWCRIIIKNVLIEGYISKGDKTINGKGEIITLDNEYKGNIVNNIKEGQGQEKTKSYIYEGFFSNGKKHGQGNIKYILKVEEYTGEFKDDLFNNYGFYVYNNKNTFEGTFLNGKMHGKGTYKWTDGSEYTGEYVNGLKEGKGKFKWKNGRVYDGPFVNGKQHGKGKLTYNNKTFDVEFFEGKIIKEKETESAKPKKANVKTFLGISAVGDVTGTGAEQKQA